jgi:hypothetical protein
MKNLIAVAALSLVMACDEMGGTGMAGGMAGDASAGMANRIQTSPEFRTQMVGRTLTAPTGETYEIGADGNLLGGTIGTWEFRGGQLCIEESQRTIDRCYFVDAAGQLSPVPGAQGI